jgi:hypothetical protein
MPVTGRGDSAPAIRNVQGDLEALRAVGVDPNQFARVTPQPEVGDGEQRYRDDVAAMERLKAAGLLDTALDGIGYPRPEVVQNHTASANIQVPSGQVPPSKNLPDSTPVGLPVLMVPLQDGLVAEIYIRGGKHNIHHFQQLGRFLDSIGEMERPPRGRRPKDGRLDE